MAAQELGADPACLINCDPKEDFGGGHPDPNLTYAKALVAACGLGEHPAPAAEACLCSVVLASASGSGLTAMSRVALQASIPHCTRTAG